MSGDATTVRGDSEPPRFTPRRSMSTPLQQDNTRSAATPPGTKVHMTMISKRQLDGPALPPRSPPLSATFKVTGNSRNSYDSVIPVEPNNSEADNHTYLEISGKHISGGDINTRLQNVESKQILLIKQFTEFKTDICEEILSLKELTVNLSKFMHESSTKIESSIEKIHFHMLENSDHLGKQVLDVRRDIAASNKKQASMSNTSAMKIYVHSFEWEIPAFNDMKVTQKECSSSVFYLDQVDCKISVRAACTKIERLRLKLNCALANSSSTSSQTCYKFECTAHLVDKSGKQPEWLVGKVFGDFTAGNEWLIGDVPTNEIHKKAFVTRSGNLHLKCVIEMCL